MTMADRFQDGNSGARKSGERAQVIDERRIDPMRREPGPSAMRPLVRAQQVIIKHASYEKLTTIDRPFGGRSPSERSYVVVMAAGLHITA
jgi:hypothetical protein